jgi:hypothetical protein
MAAGTCTVISAGHAGLSDSVSFDGYKVRYARVAFSAAYEAGGDLLIPQKLGLTTVVGLAANFTHRLGSAFTVAIGSSELTTGKSASLAGTAAAPKIQLWETAATEVINGDYSAIIIPFLFFGAGGPILA